ncbi:MAG: hypothetical protein KAS32_19295 [Candidatus Peribacteraceae bacterium]|nr:hypothetical protein [Candidatus Peribacteraceae bacterium]
MCNCKVGVTVSTNNGTHIVTCKQCNIIWYKGISLQGATIAQGYGNSTIKKRKAKSNGNSNPLFECKCTRFYSRLKQNGTVVCTCARKSCGEELYIAPNYVDYKKWASLEGKTEVYLEDNRAVPTGTPMVI